MHTLQRTVRFALNPGAASDVPARGDNGYAGVPAMRGLGRHYELTVACRGEVDSATGYFMDIKVIDRAVRSAAIPVIARACEQRPDAEPGAIMAAFLLPLDAALGGMLASVRWMLTPYYGIEMTKADTTTALLRQRFEFAASHRLHVPALSDEQNRELFGKCNHPSGHGHNYVVEPCVRVRLGSGRLFSLADLEPIVAAAVIERLDHKHLNLDLPEFDTNRAGGVNPSVENIAAACFRWLEAPIREAARGDAELVSVTVWETEKTSATFPA